MRRGAASPFAHVASNLGNRARLQARMPMPVASHARGATDPQGATTTPRLLRQRLPLGVSLPERKQNPARAEALAGRLAGMIDDGAVVAMISVGHRTGLFDTLAGDQRDHRRACRPRRALRARMARGDGHRPHRRLRPRAQHLPPAGRARSEPDPRRSPRQPRGLRPARRPPRRRPGPHARLLRDRGRHAPRRLSVLSPHHGRRQRDDRHRRPLPRHPASGGRHRGPARGRHRWMPDAARARR
jgi:hypothetical protein